MAAPDTIVTEDIVTEAAAQDVAEELETVRPRVPRRGLGSRLASATLKALPPLAVFAVIIAIWYTVHAMLGDRGFLVPRPDEVITDGFLDSTTRQQIIDGKITVPTTVS